MIFNNEEYSLFTQLKPPTWIRFTKVEKHPKLCPHQFLVRPNNSVTMCLDLKRRKTGKDVHCVCKVVNKERTYIRLMVATSRQQSPLATPCPVICASLSFETLQAVPKT